MQGMVQAGENAMQQESEEGERDRGRGRDRGRVEMYVSGIKGRKGREGWWGRGKEGACMQSLSACPVPPLQPCLSPCPAFSSFLPVFCLSLSHAKEPQINP